MKLHKVTQKIRKEAGIWTQVFINPRALLITPHHKILGFNSAIGAITNHLKHLRYLFEAFYTDYLIQSLSPLYEADAAILLHQSRGTCTGSWWQQVLDLNPSWTPDPALLLRSSSLLPGHHLWVPSHFIRVQLFATPWTAPCQAPLSIGILQARIMEWVAMPSSRGSSQPRDWTQVSHIAGRFFTIWATKEAQEYWNG